MKKTILLVIPFLIWSLSAAAAFIPKQGADKFAIIEYPATQCDVNIDEGSFEIWFQIGFDPTRNPEMAFYKPMTFLFVGSPSANPLFTVIFKGTYDPNRNVDRRHIAYTGDILRIATQPESDPLGWKKGEWHFLAVTWKDIGPKYQCQIYVDGKLLINHESDTRREIILTEDAVIRVGSNNYAGSYATVDSIRLSSVVRTAEEIAASYKNGFAWDRYTLLLDKFENLEEGKGVTTTPEHGKQGVILGSYEYVDTPTGKGIKMHVVEE